MRQTDFLVIGAGIAGLSAAARHGTVAVCEAERALGVHASGRSAAFAHFGMDDDLVRRLTALSMRHFEKPAARVHPALFNARENEMAALDALAVVHRQWAPEAMILTAAEAQALVPILRREIVAGALLDPHGRKLDSDALLQVHRRALKQAGGKLVFNAPIEAMRYDRARWIVDTAGESYAARVVVNAAGAWADRIAELAGVAPIGIRPLRRTVITFDGPQGIDVSRWPFVKTVGTGLYFEPEGTSRLLASPMDEGVSEACDAQPEEEDVALAAWKMEGTTTLTIRHIASRWAGLRSFAPDCRPVAGFAPSAPGFFWLAGQGGSGLQTSPAMALAVETLATGAVWPDELSQFGIEAEALSPARLR